MTDVVSSLTQRVLMPADGAQLVVASCGPQGVARSDGRRQVLAIDHEHQLLNETERPPPGAAGAEETPAASPTQRVDCAWRCGRTQPGRTKWQVYPYGYFCR